jgi:hypothetical protein
MIERLKKGTGPSPEANIRHAVPLKRLMASAVAVPLI